jgi:transposase
MNEMKDTLKRTHQPFWRFRGPGCGEVFPTPRSSPVTLEAPRHLWVCQHIEAGVPRFDCPKRGVRQAHVPWAEPGGRFTSLFEALTISWLQSATIKAVSEQMKITRDETSGMLERTVNRSLARRESRPIEDLAIDETSFQKRRGYVTVMTGRNSETIAEILDD